MFEPYRRDAVSKSLFRLSEIIGGALLVSVLFSSLPLFIKLAIVAGAVLIFLLAWFTCPHKTSEGELAMVEVVWMMVLGFSLLLGIVYWVEKHKKHPH